MATRKIFGLLISCTSVLIYLFVHITLNYLKKVQKNRFIEWDVKTISAADFTVEFSISPKQYDHFINNHFDPESVISEIG